MSDHERALDPQPAQQDEVMPTDVKSEMVQIVDAVLACPKCATQHIDEGEWRDRPHKTHLCVACGCLWEVKVRGVESTVLERMQKSLEEIVKRQSVPYYDEPIIDAVEIARRALNPEKP